MGEILLYSQISVVEDLLYSHFSEGKGYYIAIFPGEKMARGKGYYTTPEVGIHCYAIFTGFLLYW
jgi:hypothetical protein